MPYAGFAGVRHRKEIALNWVEYWLALAALFILLCPTSAKPTWGIIGEKAKEIKRRVVLPSYFLKLFAYFSSIPLVRYAGVGDSHKTELILSCAAFLQCPTPALPAWGIKGEKRPKGLGSG